MLSWMRINGVELNSAEVAAYVQNSSVAGYILCDCPALHLNPDTGASRSWTTPALSGAPWYSASIPESAGFLGVAVEKIIGLDGSVLSRQMTDRIGGTLGGGTLGPMHVKHRELKVQALLVATNQTSSEYGMRWLTSLLQGYGDTCTPYDVEVRTTCPPDVGANFNVGRWVMRRSGVLGGPAWDPSIVFKNCTLVRVNFQIVSEYGQFFALPVPVVATTTFSSGACTDFSTWMCGGTQLTATLTAPLVGDLSAMIVLHAGTADAGWFSVAMDGSELFYINSIPAGSTFTIDASSQQFILTAGGVSIDGTPYLHIPTGHAVRWPSVTRGQSSTVTVVGQECGMNSSTTGSINTVLRQV